MSNSGNNHLAPGKPVTVVGGGLSGLLAACLLRRRGHAVKVFERAPDPRARAPESGRSINLALAERGRFALRKAGLLEAVMRHTTPMPGRELHQSDGTVQFQPYGQQSWERIYSIERDALNLTLIESCEASGVEIYFDHRCTDVDIGQRMVVFKTSDGARIQHRFSPLIAADGAGSVVRRTLNERCGFNTDESLLDHGYKELTIPPTAYGAYRMNPYALHIWPRGEHMLIALPNPSGDFTATLFLPNDGDGSFDTIRSADNARKFMEQQFPDAARAMPDYLTELAANQRGIMGTIRCESWHYGGDVLLMGDAAHAIVPFHGQGMNAAFEDCRLLDDLLSQDMKNWDTLFAAFENIQRPNANAVADMALENYVEMRESVRHEKFHLKKALAFELERRCPAHFIPRYSMVMFRPDIGYKTAFDRGEIQAALLSEFTRGVDSLSELQIETAVSAARTKLEPIDSYH